MNIEENFKQQKEMIEWLMEKGNLHFNQAICIVALMETDMSLSRAWTHYMFPEMREDTEDQCKAALHEPEKKVKYICETCLGHFKFQSYTAFQMGTCDQCFTKHTKLAFVFNEDNHNSRCFK